MPHEPHKILIVDDEPNIVLSLEFLLGQEGYEVAVARDGPEALERAAELHPDLVLLDVMLPGLDGFEVCRQLRAREPAPKIVLLTARGRSAERLRGLDLGAELYVTKPFSTRDLMADIRRCLGNADQASVETSGG
ncbi:MAG: response regulator [Acidobacteriota bacterium]|nr:response regulator [Acidobacteriota bacterium]